MKKIMFFVTILLLLTGCKIIDNNDNNEIDCGSDTLIDGVCVTNIDNVLLDKSLTLIDIAEDTNITGSSLEIYTNGVDGIDYVNIVEFINFIDGGIGDISYLKDNDIFRITYTYQINDPLNFYEEDQFEYIVEFNYNDETIYFSDFDFIHALTIDNTEYETSLYLSNLAYDTNIDYSITIDLHDYGYNIVNLNEDVYIPFNIANLFLTGDIITLYINGTDIYLIDDPSNLEQLQTNYTEDSNQDMHLLALETKNYLKLYFNYFYGLESKLEEVNLLIDQLDEDDQHLLNKDISEYIDDIIYKLDDPHTAVIDYGRNNQTYLPSYDYITNGKYSRYLNTYFELACYTSFDEITFTELYDAYVLQINEFTLDTKDLLAQYLTNINPAKPIILDLSCNAGGNVIAVLELLSYFTDEEIPLSYTNRLFNDNTTEYYLNDEIDALDNELILITSNATFSAANLFASYVRDLNLGNIVGDNTLGGSAVVGYTVLPNGAIITNSSTTLLTNTHSNSIEEGITADAYYDLPVSKDTLINNETLNINDFILLSLEERYIDNKNLLHLELLNDTQELTVTSYTVNYYNAYTEELIDSQTYTQLPLDYELIKYNDLTRYELIMNFTYNNKDYSKILIYSFFDDFPDYASYYGKTLEVGIRRIINNSNEFYDLDVLTINVDTSGDYQFMYYDNIYDEGRLISDYFGIGDVFILIDDEANIVTRNNLTYTLDSEKTYYLYINASDSITDYQLELQTRFDDNTGTTLIDEFGDATFNIDFISDLEAFEITLEANTIATFTLNSETNIQYRFYIIEDNMMLYSSPKFNSNLTYEFMFIEGATYVIQAVDYIPVGAYSIHIDTEVLVGDIASTIDSPNMGEFVDNQALVIMDAINDRDYYHFTMEEAGYVEFNWDYASKIDSSVNEGEIYFFEAGDYYIYFYAAYDTLLDTPILITMNKIILDNDYQNEPTLEIDTLVDVYYEVASDKDYFRIIITEAGMYEFSYDFPELLSNSILVRVLDSDYNYLQTIANTNSIFYVNLPVGEYVLELEPSLGSNSINTHMTLIYSKSEMIDPEPNILGFDTQSYPLLNIEDFYTGDLEYTGDRDFFILNATSNGDYQIFYNDHEVKIVFILNGESIYLDDGEVITLTQGQYYFYVYQSSGYIRDYSLLVFLK